MRFEFRAGLRHRFQEGTSEAPPSCSPGVGLARVGLPLPKWEGGPPGVVRQAGGAPKVTRSGAGNLTGSSLAACSAAVEPEGIGVVRGQAADRVFRVRLEGGERGRVGLVLRGGVPRDAGLGRDHREVAELELLARVRLPASDPVAFVFEHVDELPVLQILGEDSVLQVAQDVLPRGPLQALVGVPVRHLDGGEGNEREQQQDHESPADHTPRDVARLAELLVGRRSGRRHVVATVVATSERVLVAAGLGPGIDGDGHAALLSWVRS